MERCLYLLVLMTAALLSYGCAEKRTAADSGDDMYVVSDGMLAVDTGAAAANGVRILDRSGGVMGGVVVLRKGRTIANEQGEAAVIETSPAALGVLDANGDGRLDDKDPLWHNMHLAVDYNGDGTIGEGEYALIGECGVDALVLNTDTGLAQSLHTDGKIKTVRMPGAG